MDEDLTANMVLGGWYCYEPRALHKHQIYRSAFLVVSWKDPDMMYADLAELGLAINEEGNIKEVL